MSILQRLSVPYQSREIPALHLQVNSPGFNAHSEQDQGYLCKMSPQMKISERVGVCKAAAEGRKAQLAAQALPQGLWIGQAILCPGPATAILPNVLAGSQETVSQVQSRLHNLWCSDSSFN